MLILICGIDTALWTFRLDLCVLSFSLSSLLPFNQYGMMMDADKIFEILSWTNILIGWFIILQVHEKTGQWPPAYIFRHQFQQHTHAHTKKQKK